MNHFNPSFVLYQTVLVFYIPTHHIYTLFTNKYGEKYHTLPQYYHFYT